MLDLSQIESFYPEPIRPFKKNILREYMQYKILEIIFDSKHAEKLVFMGGTALRIIYGNNRFSEDLDFDNFNLTEREFNEITELVQKKLALEGYSIEIRNVFGTAFHCYLSIPNILYENGISKHKEEKLMIRLDTESQGMEYPPDKAIINKFDIFTRINVVSSEMLLSHKISAILNRKLAIGRDFFDTVFLFGRAEPDFSYLKFKNNISNMHELKEKILARCEELDFKLLARDVEPFLIHPDDSKKITLFTDFIENLNTKK